MDPHTKQTKPGRSPCQGITAQGRPCSRTVAEGLTLCYRHDPARAQERSRNAAQAGQNKATDKRAVKALARVTRLEVPIADDLPSVRSLVHRSIHDVISGKIDPAIAGAVASLARVYKELDQAVTEKQLAEELADLQAEREIA